MPPESCPVCQTRRDRTNSSGFQACHCGRYTLKGENSILELYLGRVEPPTLEAVEASWNAKVSKVPAGVNIIPKMVESLKSSLAQKLTRDCTHSHLTLVWWEQTQKVWRLDRPYVRLETGWTDVMDLWEDMLRDRINLLRVEEIME